MSQLAKAVIEQINELNKLLTKDIDNNQKFEIKKKKYELYHALDRIVEADFTDIKKTPAFKQALKAVKDATKSAKDAKKSIDKVTKALKDTADALGKIEKLVKGVLGVLAVF